MVHDYDFLLCSGLVKVKKLTVDYVYSESANLYRSYELQKKEHRLPLKCVRLSVLHRPHVCIH
jgi:hypothetical protein